MGVMYVVISYFHITRLGIPILYPGGFDNHFYELLFEYSVGYFAMINTLYNYIRAALWNSDPEQAKKEYKITEESLKKLIELNKKERERVLTMHPEVQYEPIVEDMMEFKDNHKFGLYCEKCKKFRFPRAHHCSSCGI